MRRFIDLADFSRDELLALIELARRLEARPEPQALAGKVLGLLFMNPSLRTLASFQSGMARLGGASFVITPGNGTWQIETRHSLVRRRQGPGRGPERAEIRRHGRPGGQAADQSRIGGQPPMPVAGRLEDAR
jgi:hypothetical protein